jgi:hypothetical protein
MQKIYNISCCGECPAYKIRMGRTPYCEKQGRRIDEDTENPINPALIGFPAWCPLNSVAISGETNIDYRNEVKQIIRIVEDNSFPDALAEASHYLNSVVKDAKKKTETNQL